MAKRYKGSEDITSRHQLARYLAENYTRGGDAISENDAFDLILGKENEELIARGIGFRSYVYYVGDQIATAAELDEIPLADDDDDDDDDDD